MWTTLYRWVRNRWALRAVRRPFLAEPIHYLSIETDDEGNILDKTPLSERLVECGRELSESLHTTQPYGVTCFHCIAEMVDGELDP